MNSCFPFISLMIVLSFGCNTGPDYKSIRKEVIDVHDQVMDKSATLIQNKMKLESLMFHPDSIKQINPGLDTSNVKKEMGDLIAELNTADEQMNNWMHHFEPDAGDKSNEEAVKYFQQELVKVKAIDSTFSEEINRSNNYLSKLKSK